MSKILNVLGLILLAGPSFARAATCYRSQLIAIAGAAKPAVVTVAWPDRGDVPGAISVKAGHVLATTTIFCDHGTCRLEGDLGSVTLLGRGEDLNLIARDGQLAIGRDDGGDPFVQKVAAPTHEYALKITTPAACRKLAPERGPIVVFPQN